ncbi:S41 family peptidase [Stieleria sp. JC731]|uniref:S41 family peptidase n=1 Tax=Pirellulaceae TaxID=2691357 RepID=UPI001E458E9D|nr:S41 family peptidase [Stieleria sp. JC731]MCC9601642.1 S41 family peptidase [Stieleria sp. JC731]
MPLFARVGLSRLACNPFVNQRHFHRAIGARSTLRAKLLMTGVVLFGGGATSGSLHAQTSTMQPLPAAVESAKQIETDPLNVVLEDGAALEIDRRWTEAIRHYEKAFRDFPNSRQVYQRLIICRLHADVNRRYRDRSFVDSVHQMTAAQALDLYSEILSNLETHYVEHVDWSRVFLHGTAALEIALTENRYVTDVLPEADQEKVHQFQQTIHRRISNRPTNGRHDLRAAVATVAELARNEIGLSPTAVVLEYVSGAVSTLDPYTRLLSGDQLDDMFSNIEGNFVGLGVELRPSTDSLEILSVIPNGPAEEAGLKAGDRIVRVEQADTRTGKPEIAADLLRGPEDSFVSIAVQTSEGAEREYNIARRRVEVPCVENVHICDPSNGVGYLRLTNFQKTTPRDVEQAIWQLQQQGMRSLIMDLRGNPGGLLSAAVDIADRFLSQGRIVTTRGRNSRENFDYVAHRTKTLSFPLAVLIDNDSASASEIFAGAMSDSGRGVIVGQRSYGKGSVQGIFRMQAAKFGLCLTTAKFYSPNGTAISQRGVFPDVPVESQYIAARPNDEGEIVTDLDDEVMQQAIGQLSGQSQLISQRTR